MERMKSIKETLLNRVLAETLHLDSVDTKELGEVIDMIKDMEEAIYYCTITKAMNEKEQPKEKEHHYYTERYMYPEPWEDNVMYYDGGRMSGGSRGSNGRGNNQSSNGSSRYYGSDYRMKMYSETHGRKSIKELEDYLHELSSDITEMISDATPEERHMLKKKVSELSDKIEKTNS